MWIDTYGSEDPPEVTLNIYFLGKAHHPELARISDETREVRWFSSENIPINARAFATSIRPSVAGLRQETVNKHRLDSRGPVKGASWRGYL